MRCQPRCKPCPRGAGNAQRAQPILSPQRSRSSDTESTETSRGPLRCSSPARREFPPSRGPPALRASRRQPIITNGGDGAPPCKRHLPLFAGGRRSVSAAVLPPDGEAMAHAYTGGFGLSFFASCAATIAFASAAFISASANGCSSSISCSDIRPVSHARFIG